MITTPRNIEEEQMLQVLLVVVVEGWKEGGVPVWSNIDPIILGIRFQTDMPPSFDIRRERRYPFFKMPFEWIRHFLVKLNALLLVGYA
jgi:hypothetical protein